MKKIFLILTILILGAALGYSQNAEVDRTLDYGNQTYLLYTGIASDTIGIADSTWTYTVRKKTDTRLLPYVYVELDSISGTPNPVHTILQGKVFASELYTDIDSVVWAGTIDTMFTIDVVDTFKYEFWRVSVEGQLDEFKAKVQELDIKFIK